MSDYKRYKITLTGKNLYREIELDDRDDRLVVGTEMDSDIRLRKDIFFDSIELTFTKKGEIWNLNVSDNMFINVGDVKKLATVKLEHGDSFHINYNNPNAIAFDLEFMLDFDDGNVKYERIIDIASARSISIGTLSTNDITINSTYTDKDRIVLENIGSGYKLKIENSTYGVYINGSKAKDGDIVKDKDFLEISDFFFYFNEGKLLTQIKNGIRVNSFSYEDKPEPSNYPKFRCNTRIRTVLCEDPIEILDPPAKPQKPKSNLFVSLLPSLGMLLVAGIMFSYGGSMIIISAISAVMGITTSVIGIIESKKQFKEGSSERLKVYNAYIDNKRVEIEKCRKQEITELEGIYPYQDEELDRIDKFSDSLFDREISDSDFLCLNIGVGDIESRRKINCKKQEKLSIEDDLQLVPEQICNEYKYLHNAPIICDLKEINALGVVGDREARFNFLRNAVIDLISRQYFNDLSLLFVADDDNASTIKSLRFLPHVSNCDFEGSNIGITDEGRNAIFEFIYKEINEREQSKTQGKHIILFLVDECGFGSHPVSRYINKAKELNITFIIFGEELSTISQGCDSVCYLNDSGCMLTNCHDRNACWDFNNGTISQSQIEHAVEVLAPVESEEISLEGTLTKNISFFELFNILSTDDINLEQNWKTSKVSESMSAPIGVSKIGIVSLDIHDKAHGPHGLVAGTTGSGKSEVLQTYILSLAMLYHPYEVAFLIIDFKGGGMANQFRDLPHLLGAITNIDGKEINRSLKSIKAELNKRQRLFAEVDVNHIDKYIEKYKSGSATIPLPHLIIIVDEFAELKAEQPDFMQELISTARIGRSLGVHLILATQKPAGQVNDQIWSNSRFKLCLKVQDKQDSNEVLKSPLAAEIKEAGRGYLQVGNNEIFELFQSAYSGAPEKQFSDGNRSFKVRAINDSGKRSVVYERKVAKIEGASTTQLDAIVDKIDKYCIDNSIEKIPNICLAPLPDKIDFVESDRGISIDKKYCISLGLYDDPDNQQQLPYEVDFSETNLMILGSAQTGKSNVLQDIVRGLSTQCTPNEVNIYILDFASMSLKVFDELNHVGGVVCASDDEKLINLFKLLKAQIAIRKELFLEKGVSSFSTYKESGFEDLPLIVLLIDNLTALKELYFQDDDELIALCREGLTYGISVVIANSQTSGIGYRYFSNFSTRMALYCNDSSEYNSLFDFCRERIDNIPGRSIVEVEKTHYECQTYMAYEGEKEIDRVNEIKNYIDKMNEKTKDMHAPLIPEIPSILTKDMVNKVFDSSIKNTTSVIAGLNYANVEPVLFDFSTINTLNLCGKRSDVICEYINYLVSTLIDRNKKGVGLYVVDGISKDLNSLNGISKHSEYSFFAEDGVRYITEIDTKLKKRYDEILAGNEDIVNNSELLVLVLNNMDAIQAICSDADALKAYKNITSRYKNLGVAILSVVDNAAIAYSAPDMLKDIREEKNVMYFDNLSTMKLFDCSMQVLREFKKPIEVGDAFVIKGDDCVKVKTVRG